MYKYIKQQSLVSCYSQLTYEGHLITVQVLPN